MQNTPCLDPDILLGTLLNINKIQAKSSKQEKVDGSRCRTPRYPFVAQNRICLKEQEEYNFLGKKKVVPEALNGHKEKPKRNAQISKANSRVTTKIKAVNLKNKQNLLLNKNPDASLKTPLNDQIEKQTQTKTPFSNKSFEFETHLKTHEISYKTHNKSAKKSQANFNKPLNIIHEKPNYSCLLYTSPSPRD
eukprot:TRINITY_DN6408_c0_g2_i1.p1 TRINITY_DN6408_c0_g2~~TRINITY_DN6408_c0_g2_i1.p1  ORF type:complete len:192 (-),score=28.11 TRINITY_DN6408_c0_g2_i1:47-622(-)